MTTKSKLLKKERINDKEKDREGLTPSQKIYESHIARDKFKDVLMHFLTNSKKTSITLDGVVESPLKTDIMEKFELKIVGQDEAKKHLADTILSAIETVREKENGPLKTLFFAGNTGVGKTEIARVLAEICFGYKRGLTTVPCEQYGESHTARNLLGSTKSYVGFGEPTPLADIRLFKAYRESKQEKTLHESLYKLDDFAILLFDEIEKAHDVVKQALLGIMSSGIHEFSTGIEDNPKECKFSRETDFQNVIIIFTSNVGTKAIQKRGIGFLNESDEAKHENMVSTYKKELENHFSAEFIGRLDEIIYFSDLTESNYRKMISNYVDDLNETYGAYYDFKVQVKLTEKAIDQLIKEGSDNKTGARKLKRVFFRHVEDRLNNYLVGGGIQEMLPGGRIVCFEIDFENDNYTYKLNKLNQTSSSKKRIMSLVRHVLQKKKAHVVHDAMFPDVVPIMSEILFLQDRYRRAYHLYSNEGLEVFREMRHYEFMLRELGHTNEDIEKLEKFADHEIFEPKDVFATLAHNCEFHASNSIFYFEEDNVIEKVVESVMKKYPHMKEDKLRNKIFKTISFLLGSELNSDQSKLLHDMISVKLGRIVEED